MLKLEIKNLNKRYGKKTVLDCIDLTLYAGVYGLLGINGAGKTTLINILVGLLSASSGEVFMDGTNTKVLKRDYFAQLGYLPQYPHFYKNFRADEFLDYICALKAIPKADRKERIDEVLEIVHLTEDRRNYIGTFSGGMRQRLGIAQAIINNPKILILDEPTAGLDPKERIRFRNLISNLSASRIVVLATHIVSDIEHIAKEVIILKSGKVVKKDTPISLIKSMRGKVFMAEASDKELEEKMERYMVSNVTYDGRYHLQIVTDHKEDGFTECEHPSLEDVFLYYS